VAGKPSEPVQRRFVYEAFARRSPRSALLHRSFTNVDGERSALLHHDAATVDGLAGGDDPPSADVAEVDRDT